MRFSITCPRQSLRLLSIGAIVLATTAACAKTDVPATDTTSKLAPAPVDSSAAAPAARPALANVRGTIAAITDTALTITTATGPQQVLIVAPLRVFARTASDLAHVTPKSFVGITSVAQPDGSEHATEIHVFPEELRGMGEGSRMMGTPAAGAAPSRMTNGNVADSRMTNGTVGSAGGGTYTVEYQGGTQKIIVPANVAVTIIATTTTKLTVGASVVALGKTGADGRVRASSVMLSGSPSGH